MGFGVDGLLRGLVDVWRAVQLQPVDLFEEALLDALVLVLLAWSLEAGREVGPPLRQLPLRLLQGVIHGEAEVDLCVAVGVVRMRIQLLHCGELFQGLPAFVAKIEVFLHVALGGRLVEALSDVDHLLHAPDGVQAVVIVVAALLLHFEVGYFESLRIKMVVGLLGVCERLVASVGQL